MTPNGLQTYRMRLLGKCAFELLKCAKHVPALRRATAPAFDREFARGITEGLDNDFDLAALNVQRGRDHGVPGYNKYRKGNLVHVLVLNLVHLGDRDAFVSFPKFSNRYSYMTSVVEH